MSAGSFGGGGSSPPPARRRWLIAGGGTAVFLAVMNTLPAPRVTDLGVLALVAVPTAAGTFCLRAGRARADVVGRGWLSVGVGCLAWAAGMTGMAWYQFRVGAHPFPSVADVGFAALYLPAVVGLLAVGRPRRREAFRPRAVLDGLVLSAALLFISWALVLGPALSNSRLGPLAAALAVGYPLADVVVLAIGLPVLARGLAERRRALALAAAGLITVAVADSTLLVVTLEGAYGPAGQLPGLGYLTGFLLLLMAAVEAPSDDAVVVPDERVRLPGVALLVLPTVGVLAVATARQLDGLPLDGFLFWDTIVLVFVLVARQALTLRENQRLTRRLQARVSDLRLQERELRHRVLHDALTGLPNRVLFTDRLARALAQPTPAEPRHGDCDRAGSASTAVRSGVEPPAPGLPGLVGVLYCDLDDFKSINDRFGHDAGDAVLTTVARRLIRCVRDGDTVARLGGDEFAVVLSRTTPDEADAVARRILAAVRAPMTISRRPLVAEVTVGCALGVPGGTAPVELLRRADTAMYVAKDGGKGRHRLEPVEVGAAGRVPTVPAAAGQVG